VVKWSSGRVGKIDHSTTQPLNYFVDMELIRLLDYSLRGPGGEAALQEISFSLNRGDRVSIIAHVRHDVRLFMRGLASLVCPTSGKFFYQGKELDFSDYRNLLPYKQKVGYIASDVSFISNRSVQDNLMFMINYFENKFFTTPPDDIMKLCRLFHLDEKLELRSTYLDPENMRIAIIIREICKNPDIMLIDRPKEFLGTKSFDTFKSVLRGLADTGTTLIFHALDEDFIKEFATREIVIEEGKIQKEVPKVS
jgi:ABC-type ATPase involved in cell division